MKNLIIAFTLVLAANVYAGKSFTTAVEYNDFLVTEVDHVIEKYAEVNAAFENETIDEKQVWAAHRALLKQCKTSVDNVMDAEIFMEGGSFKTACIELLNMYTTFAETDFVETIEVVLDKNREQTALDRVSTYLDVFEANEKIYTLLFQFAQEDYSLKYQFALAE